MTIIAEPSEDYENLLRQFLALRSMYNRQHEIRRVELQYNDKLWEERLQREKEADRELIEHLTNLLEES